MTFDSEPPQTFIIPSRLYFLKYSLGTSASIHNPFYLCTLGSKQKTRNAIALARGPFGSRDLGVSAGYHESTWG